MERRTQVLHDRAALARQPAEFPLLYPPGRSKEIPEIKYPPKEKDGEEEGVRPEARQRAGKLEDKPFLESLPVYRYRPEHR